MHWCGSQHVRRMLSTTLPLLQAAQDACRKVIAAAPRMCGFDMEWRVQFIIGQAPRDVALIQICYEVPASPASHAQPHIAAHAVLVASNSRAPHSAQAGTQSTCAHSPHLPPPNFNVAVEPTHPLSCSGATAQARSAFASSGDAQACARACQRQPVIVAEGRAHVQQQAALSADHASSRAMPTSTTHDQPAQKQQQQCAPEPAWHRTAAQLSAPGCTSAAPNAGAEPRPQANLLDGNDVTLRAGSTPAQKRGGGALPACGKRTCTSAPAARQSGLSAPSAATRTEPIEELEPARDQHAAVTAAQANHAWRQRQVLQPLQRQQTQQQIPNSVDRTGHEKVFSGVTTGCDESPEAFSRQCRCLLLHVKRTGAHLL